MRIILPAVRSNRIDGWADGGEALQMTALDPDRFIDEAIEVGGKRGLAALGDLAGRVFLISEAEVLCDLEGIDSFLDQYGSAGLSQLCAAFDTIGAESIAASCRVVLESMPRPNEPALDRLNSLISDRAGYDYGSLRSMVARELGTGWTLLKP
jgi:hypothetical protein